MKNATNITRKVLNKIQPKNLGTSVRRMTFKWLIVQVLMLCSQSSTFAQKPKLAVLGIDVKVDQFRNQNITELVRIQVTKYDRFQLIDRYEIADALKTASIDANSCFSLSCLTKAGEALKVDKIISGSLDQMGEVLYVRLRLVDVKSGDIEKEAIKEFLMLPEYVNSMVTLTLNALFGLPNDNMLEKSLTSKNNYENAVNNPNYNALALSGPRMGYAFFTGEAASKLQESKAKGGYDAFPAMFQFGYQFEKQYLNEGKFQALFEFIPMVAGLDQQMFVPSFTFMNGLRNNDNGLEFAIGPTFAFVKEARYYQNEKGEWIYDTGVLNRPVDAVLEYKMDSRGIVRLKSSIVIAVGMSLRSGKMNIPINAFVVPGKQSTRFGVSFGFNARGN